MNWKAVRLSAAREWLWLLACCFLTAAGYASYNAYAASHEAKHSVATMARLAHPKAYDDLSDKDLESAILKKYPHYPIVPPDAETLATVTVGVPDGRVYVFDAGTTDDDKRQVLGAMYPNTWADTFRAAAWDALHGVLFGPCLYAALGLVRLTRWAVRTVGAA